LTTTSSTLFPRTLHRLIIQNQPSHKIANRHTPNIAAVATSTSTIQAVVVSSSSSIIISKTYIQSTMHEITTSDNKVNSKKCVSPKKVMSESTRNRRKWWNVGTLRGTQSLRSSSAQKGSVSPNVKRPQSCSLTQASSPMKPSDASSPMKPSDARQHRKTISKIDDHLLWQMSAVRKMPAFSFIN
jgi:hypothetical protein